MPASIEILPIPIGSQLTRRITGNEPADKNDFKILIIGDVNMTGLNESDITLSVVSERDGVITGASVVNLEGANSVWIATIRPPDTVGNYSSTAVLTVTLAANAVDQENAETSKDIRISTRFPDTDAETPTQLFAHGLGRVYGLTVTPSLLKILADSPGFREYAVKSFRFDGTAVTLTEILKSTSDISPADFEYANGDYFFHTGGSGLRRYLSTLTTAGLTTFVSETINYAIASNLGSIIHTRLGVAAGINLVSPLRNFIRYKSYDNKGNATELDMPLNTTGRLAHQNDLIYGNTVYRITDTDELEYMRALNVNNLNLHKTSHTDTLYLLNSTHVLSVDIRKYRPIAKNTKTTIYPIFAAAGDTIDLKQFSPDAERIVFDVGFDRPTYLSINARNKLVLGSGAKTCFVKLKAINRIDATETESFGFYLIIRQATPPVWRNVSELTMRAGSRYDLFQLVSGATSIQFRVGVGFSRPAGSSVSNGVFTVGAVGGAAHFTARNGNGVSHIKITMDVVSGIGVGTDSEVSGYRIEIAGIEVTSDSVGLPSVSETLDPVVINEYRVNEASIVLRNEKGKYNSEIAGNFWETHGLNAGGFQNSVKIYTKHSDGTEHLLFLGLINESFEPIGEATFKLNCVDISSRLRKALVQDFGTLEKWDALRKASDAASYAGSYVPERSLSPMQVGTGRARSDRTDVDIRRLALPSEGPVAENTGYMTPTAFLTAGGFLETNPLLRFKAEHQSEDVRFLINQLARNKEVYNTEIDIPGVEVAEPFLLNRGSIAFSVEQTRTTRLPVDWVYDSTQNRMLILLSNPEAHIADLLVQYDIASDSYRVLHTFGKDIAVHRIVRRSGTQYYILTSAKITEDRSATELPRQTDRTAYASDSAAAGSTCRIYHFNASTNVLSSFVSETNARPPQVSIHYHVGFENGVYTDAFEGIVPSPYSAFKWHSNALYYRYAKDSEFGVARANTGGTTTKLIGETRLNHQNHLNFAFDINSSGTLYFVYATGEADSSTLTIKRRTSGGTLTTIVSETRGIGDFNELGFDFGAFLGCHEALFHNNNLYILVPIQKVDFGDDARSVVNPDVHIVQRSAEKSGERNVTTNTNVNPSNKVLAPGDDIPLRIDFDGSVSGATQSDLTVYGGTIQSFSISSDMIDVTIRPDSKARHKNIIIDLAEDAVDQGNEAWRIVISFDTHRSRQKTAGCVLYRVSTNTANPTLEVIEKWDFVQRSGCGLTVHAGNVHYVENPPVSTRFKPINPDL